MDELSGFEAKPWGDTGSEAASFISDPLGSPASKLNSSEAFGGTRLSRNRGTFAGVSLIRQMCRMELAPGMGHAAGLRDAGRHGLLVARVVVTDQRTAPAAVVKFALSAAYQSLNRNVNRDDGQEGHIVHRRPDQ